MTKNAFHLYLPESRTTSVVFASPHSGRLYPAEFLNASILDERLIRTSEDAFVDLLLEQVTAFGAPLLTATAPRAYVDLNRAADELDPAVVEGDPADPFGAADHPQNEKQEDDRDAQPVDPAAKQYAQRDEHADDQQKQCGPVGF